MPTESEILQSLRPTISVKQLNAVAQKAKTARDLEQTISDLEQRLSECKAQLRDIYRVELPDLMDQAQTDRIGLPAEGNMPAYDLRLLPYYNANIAANWEPERREAAFKTLREFGHDDLIKTVVSLIFSRQQNENAQSVIRALRSLGYEPGIKETVHFKTLTAWLKEQYEAGNALPPLEVIGAEVGRIVKMTERTQ
jgi:hypothetical protein